MREVLVSLEGRGSPVPQVRNSTAISHPPPPVRPIHATGFFTWFLDYSGFMGFLVFYWIANVLHKKSSKSKKFYRKQECIPVGCIPPAAVAVCLGRGCLPQCILGYTPRPGPGDPSGCGPGEPPPGVGLENPSSTLQPDPSTSPQGVGLETPPLWTNRQM